MQILLQPCRNEIQNVRLTDGADDVVFDATLYADRDQKVALDLLDLKRGIYTLSLSDRTDHYVAEERDEDTGRTQRIMLFVLD